MTAAEAGFARCHDCGRLEAYRGGHMDCPRCGTPLHLRKPESLQRTWALIVAASVLYVPANALPIMTITSLGSTTSDTIMSGVLSLYTHGMWPLALLVFFASVVVPVLKLIALGYLAASVQWGVKQNRKARTVLYRVAEGLGRWSMVDIYVVTILVGLVHLGTLAEVDAEAGAAFFGAVVIVTMVAAESFDPRLIWDAAEGKRVG